MRNIIILLLMIFPALAGAQSPASRVRANMGEQEGAWNRGDLNAFMEHYWKNDSLKFISKKGITYGWQQTLDNYKKSYPNKETMGELTFTLLEVTTLSKSAVYVIGKWQLKKDKPAGGHFTLLWRRIEGRWVIVSDHTS